MRGAYSRHFRTTITSHSLLSRSICVRAPFSGSVPVRSELFAPGTQTVRTGLLATMVDLIAGHAPNGPVGPTIDLRVSVVAPPPTTGRIHLVCRPLRVAARV